MMVTFFIFYLFFVSTPNRTDSNGYLEIALELNAWIEEIFGSNVPAASRFRSAITSFSWNFISASQAPETYPFSAIVEKSSEILASWSNWTSVILSIDSLSQKNEKSYCLFIQPRALKHNIRWCLVWVRYSTSFIYFVIPFIKIILPWLEIITNFL